MLSLVIITDLNIYARNASSTTSYYWHLAHICPFPMCQHSFSSIIPKHNSFYLQNKPQLRHPLLCSISMSRGRRMTMTPCSTSSSYFPSTHFLPTQEGRKEDSYNTTVPVLQSSKAQYTLSSLSLISIKAITHPHLQGRRGGRKTTFMLLLLIYSDMRELSSLM